MSVYLAVCRGWRFYLACDLIGFKETRVEASSAADHVFVRYTREPIFCADDTVVPWVKSEGYRVAYFRLNAVGLCAKSANICWVGVGRCRTM